MRLIGFEGLDFRVKGLGLLLIDGLWVLHSEALGCRTGLGVSERLPVFDLWMSSGIVLVLLFLYRVRVFRFMPSIVTSSSL